MGGTTSHGAGGTHSKVSRRTFLRGGALGIAGVLGGAPASWAARELSLLTAVNYAPASDAKLDELGKRFAKLAGVTVRIDHIQSVQMPAKLSAELMSRSGHDIMSLEMHYPWLFQPGLADVSDLCQALARQHGEWYPFLREHALVKGQWLGVPYLYSSFPGSPHRPVREGGREGARDLGRPAAGRAQAQEARPPRRLRHQPDDRLGDHALLDSLVLRRQGRRRGRQDDRHQLPRDRGGHRLRPDAVRRRHGAGC